MTAEGMLDLIRCTSGIEYSAEYTISYARRLLRNWGFTRKVPVGRHVRRASRWKIAGFRRSVRRLIEKKRSRGLHDMRAGRVHRHRRRPAPEGCLHPQGRAGRLHVHRIPLQDHRLRADHHRRRGILRAVRPVHQDQFVDFLKEAHQRFGKILMIVDGAAQHRAQWTRNELKKLDGVELKFLPPGCPDLSAIEEIWRRMKHAVRNCSPHIIRQTINVSSIGRRLDTKLHEQMKICVNSMLCLMARPQIHLSNVKTCLDVVNTYRTFGRHYSGVHAMSMDELWDAREKEIDNPASIYETRVIHVTCKKQSS